MIKIIMENCLFISKSINFNLPSILNHWFTFSSASHNYEISSSSNGLLTLIWVGFLGVRFEVRGGCKIIPI